jgi:hypothetical protein
MLEGPFSSRKTFPSRWERLYISQKVCSFLCSNYRQDAATEPAKDLPRLEGILFQNVTGRRIVYAGRLNVSFRSPSFARAGTRRNSLCKHQEREPCKEMLTSAATDSGPDQVFGKRISLCLGPASCWCW